MKRLICSLSFAALLAACGADGMPTRPEPKEEKKEASEAVVEPVG